MNLGYESGQSIMNRSFRGLTFLYCKHFFGICLMQYSKILDFFSGVLSCFHQKLNKKGLKLFTTQPHIPLIIKHITLHSHLQSVSKAISDPIKTVGYVINQTFI